MADEVAQAGRPDPPGAEVLVAVEARPASERESLRWTRARRSRPIRASKSARKASMAAGEPTSMPGAPGVGGVQAEADPGARHAAGGRWRRRWRPARRCRAEPPAAAGRVLEDERAASRAGLDRLQRGGHAVGDPLDAFVDGRPRCDPMWTLTKLAPNVGATSSSLASRSTDGSKNVGSGPARLTR